MSTQCAASTPPETLRPSVRSTFSRDLIDTFITSGLTVLALVLTLRLLAQALGPEGFGAYSIARRILSTLDPVLTVTMGTAVTRYIALTNNERIRHNYLLAGLMIGVAPSMVCLLIGTLCDRQLAGLLFRDGEYRPVIIRTLFLMVGYCFFIILYSFYRGRGEMRKANLWQLTVIAIGPLSVAWLFSSSRDVGLILALNAVLCFTSLAPLLYHTFRRDTAGQGAEKDLESFSTCFRELFRYGLTRVPGGFAFPGILAIGPFLAPYVGTLSHAGYLLAGQSVLRVVEGGTEALSRVALPRWARLSRDENGATLRARISDVVAFAIHIGTFATLHLLLWCDQIIVLLLGNEYLASTPVLRILIFAVLPFLTYSMLRPIIDAVDPKPVNSRNACYAFILCAVLSVVFSLLGLNVMGLAAATAAALTWLSLLTVRHLVAAYSVSTGDLCLLRMGFLNAVFLALAGILNLSISHWNASGLLPQALLGVFFEAILFGAYCLSLWKSGVPWTVEMVRRFRRVHTT